jgi:HEPN domain-containing protein
MSQQSAEKYLKALREEQGLTIPRTHILGDLLALLQSDYPSLSPLRRGMLFLTGFAVDNRYPGKNASKREATSALGWAGRVRTAARTILGIGRSRPRRK